MTDFYVLPAHLIENIEPVTATGAKDAAEKVAEAQGIEGGEVVVIPVDRVQRKLLRAMPGSVEALDP